MLSNLLDKAISQVKGLNKRYQMSLIRLNEHISMRPRDIIGRSVLAGNYSTLLVIVICYPLLLYFRGLDYHLILGMILHYFTFWLVIVTLVTVIQVLWLLNYFLSQRFVGNLLDFEILDKVLGLDNPRDDVSDFEDDSDSEGRESKRASG